MRYINYLGLIFPIVIFFAGFMILNANLLPVSRFEFPTSASDTSKTETENSDTLQSEKETSKKVRPINLRSVAQISEERQSLEKRSTPEAAFPYFILASVLVMLILLLPRLQEISISNNALVLKLLTEVKNEAGKLETNSFLEQKEAMPSKHVNNSSSSINSIKDKIQLIEELLTKRK